jgi:hypothetical protein
VKCWPDPPEFNPAGGNQEFRCCTTSGPSDSATSCWVVFLPVQFDEKKKKKKKTKKELFFFLLWLTLRKPREI